MRSIVTVEGRGTLRGSVGHKRFTLETYMAAVKRTDLQAVAQGKIDDAEYLLKNQRYSNAFYLAGYAIEIGLKACIAKQFSAHALPDKKFVMDVHVHDLKKLVGLAGLTAELRKKEAASRQFSVNWALVTEWTPEIRYGAIDALTAQIMVVAVTDVADGVLPWIKTVW